MRSYNSCVQFQVKFTELQKKTKLEDELELNST